MTQFAESFGSVLKFATLAQELKRSKLENEEYASTAAHRESMRRLAEMKGNTELTLGNLQSQLLQAELAREPLKDEQGKAELAGTKARTAGTEAETENTKARTGILQAELAGTNARTRLIESQTEGSELGNLGAQFDLAQKLGTSIGFTEEDFGTAATELGKTLGIKDAPGSARHTVLSQVIKGQAVETMRAKSELDTKNLAARQAAILDQATEFADSAMRTSNPAATMDTLAEAFGERAGVAVTIARKMVENQIKSKAQVYAEAQVGVPRSDPEEASYGKFLGEERAALELSIAGLEAKDKLNSTEKRELVEKKRKLDSIRGGKPEKSKAGTKKLPINPQTGFPVVNSQEDYDSLAIGTRFFDPVENKVFVKR